mgnify:CR=1 FL=1
MFLRKPVTKEKIENMNKNKLFKVFVMIAFIMCSCEDNFDPKMYGTLNVSNYPVTEAEYESFMMTCYMPLRQHGPIGSVPEQVAISTVGISLPEVY